MDASSTTEKSIPSIVTLNGGSSVVQNGLSPVGTGAGGGVVVGGVVPAAVVSGGGVCGCLSPVGTGTGSGAVGPLKRGRPRNTPAGPRMWTPLERANVWVHNCSLQAFITSVASSKTAKEVIQNGGYIMIPLVRSLRLFLHPLLSATREEESGYLTRISRIVCKNNTGADEDDKDGPKLPCVFSGPNGRTLYMPVVRFLRVLLPRLAENAADHRYEALIPLLRHVIGLIPKLPHFPTQKEDYQYHRAGYSPPQLDDAADEKEDQEEANLLHSAIYTHFEEKSRAMHPLPLPPPNKKPCVPSSKLPNTDSIEEFVRSREALADGSPEMRATWVDHERKFWLANATYLTEKKTAESWSLKLQCLRDQLTCADLEKKIARNSLPLSSSSSSTSWRLSSSSSVPRSDLLHGNSSSGLPEPSRGESFVSSSSLHIASS